MQPVNDPLSEELHECFNPSIDHILSSLDGDVQSQGIRLSHKEWLDMGSEEWGKTEDKAKAYAYQAAVKIGSWSDLRLKELMLKKYEHIKESFIDLTIEELKSLSEKYPLDIEQTEVKDLEVKVQKRS